jgi:hypothetical protein
MLARFLFLRVAIATRTLEGAMGAMRVPYDPQDPRLSLASRSTRWRARKRGWWCPGYRQRIVIPSDEPLSEEDGLRILELARRGTLAAMMLLGLDGDLDGEIEDAQQTAALRLLELAGHQGFASDDFCLVVARNAASTFFKSVLTRRKYEK